MTPAPPPKPQAVGPIGLAFSVSFGLVSVAVGAWIVGMLIEIGGGYFLWKGQGIRHAQSLVQQDLEYIAAAPRSLLVRDTVAFSLQIAGWVRLPYEKLGVLRWYQRAHASAAAEPTATSLAGHTVAPQLRGIGVATADAARVLSEWLVISMFVAQDVLLRMAIGAFAMPAFVLACLIGVVDGLVRRDRRRWTGGRESSFVYHHAKRYTGWALTGGFGLYLSWPFGGFNPAHMVLVFTVLVAVTLSTTVGAFKKYA